MARNQLTSLPKSLGQLINLQNLAFDGNPLTNLSTLQQLNRPYLEVRCFGIYLPRRYWKKFTDWQPECLFDEDNTEIRHVLIQQLG
jgi:Leucine-rich repeat (LRR) protein